MDSMRKSVLITGASSGIGREIVRILASSYNVIIHYNNNYESALELKKEIDKKYNKDFLMVKSNLNNEEEIDNITNDIKYKCQKIKQKRILLKY